MSSQKGNTSRSRGQKYQNTTAFKNNKYGTSVQVKKANAKVHDGVCKHCKDVLEWKVKYNKYKSLTQPRKCVKCLQKSVKDAYHIMCKPCALRLELCAKCGKKEDIVVSLQQEKEDEKGAEGDTQDTCQKGRGRHSRARDEFDDEDDDDDEFGSDSDLEDCDSDLEPESEHSKDPVPSVTSLKIQDNSKQ
ncbi:uncharacterized protein C9orf85 homolog [Megalops cyprinoides]|uniref:uncharacterized protein C9orf85 homolog n=1 Tax=Megalops cyprinoides TaxID=118141 RepID=UPI0018652C2A|nr:uncharacterized protein C9orf85 homolog [Megalops cyprinoides]